MKTSTKVAIFVPGVVVAALIGAMFGYAVWVGIPTEGSPIGSYQNPRTALLVVDLQEDFTGPDAVQRMKRADGAVLAAGRLVAQAVGNDQPVAYIRAVFNDPGVRFMMGGLSAPGEPGSKMDRRLPSLPSIPVLTKTKGDAFSNPELDDWLIQNQVNHVIIVGIDAFYCVDDTIQGALNRGYKVTAVLDAISTGTNKDVATIAEKWRAAGVVIQ